MAGSEAARSPRPVVVLFVVSVIAFLAASALTVVAVAEEGPRPCCAGPVAASGARPSPTTAPPATRAPAPAPCVVGSWLTVDETMMIKFYTDVGELPMTTSGRTYEFRADGTAVERNRDVQIVGEHNGTPIRLVVDGWREFTWTATAKTITYRAVTRADQTLSYYDNRGLLNTLRAKADPRHHEVYDYSCADGRLVESNARGYHSVWTRTAGHGYYG